MVAQGHRPDVALWIRVNERSYFKLLSSKSKSLEVKMERKLRALLHAGFPRFIRGTGIMTTLERSKAYTEKPTSSCGSRGFRWESRTKQKVVGFGKAFFGKNTCQATFFERENAETITL
uniref:Uncharacterized protein n=1 Tax=Panagrellus redivivus TaxID=6233 RepID=A0A7E4WDG2_PANRE